MLDHIIVTVSDFTRSIAFYEQALKPLGITDLLDYKGRDSHPDLKGFGTDGRFFFWLKEGRPDPDTVHFGFVAKSRAETARQTELIGVHCAPYVPHGAGLVAVLNGLGAVARPTGKRGLDPFCCCNCSRRTRENCTGAPAPISS
jgi:catechol 2,3-dioxygenase-like lactoylglutathione lyase family enzyme